MEYLIHRCLREHTCKCGTVFSGPPVQKVCAACQPATRKQWRKKYERRKRALRCLTPGVKVGARESVSGEVAAGSL